MGQTACHIRPGLMRKGLLLYMLLHALNMLLQAPKHFNDSRMVFPPKGKQKGDSTDLVRLPSDTRPLSLKNCDNKLLCAVNNHNIKVEIGEQTHKMQNVFICGRNFCENVVALDAMGRAVSSATQYAVHKFLDEQQCEEWELEQNRELSNLFGDFCKQHDFPFLPLLALFDFKAAFPSILHAWVLLCVRYGLNAGLHNLVSAIYHDNHAYALVNGELIFLFLVTSGVLQGCPLSGTIFNVCVDPFYRQIAELLTFANHSLPRACADDVGCVIGSLGLIVPLASIFEDIRFFTGLALNTSKCKFIPIGQSFTEGLTLLIKAYVQQLVPSWSNFQVVDTDEYLGVWVGPNSISNQFLKQIDTYIDRSKSVA